MHIVYMHIPNQNYKLIRNPIWGLPRWSSSWESACQCRRQGFSSCSGKIPHAEGQLSPCATTSEACGPYSPSSATKEATAMRSPSTTAHNWRKALQEQTCSTVKKKKKKKRIIEQTRTVGRLEDAGVTIICHL